MMANASSGTVAFLRCHARFGRRGMGEGQGLNLTIELARIPRLVHIGIALLVV